MAKVVSFATAAEPPPAPDGYVETETSADMMRSLRLLRVLEGPSLTMIAGAPGTGKSRTIDAFEAECERDGTCQVTRITVAKGEGAAWNLATMLAALWGVTPAANGWGLTDARSTLARWIGRDAILIVDEAQYLDQRTRKTSLQGAGFEWLRALAETAGCGLAFVGDLALEGAVARFPQLQSRLRRPVVVRHPAAADVEALARAGGLHDRGAIALLGPLARRKGGLRNVENVLCVARLFAGDGPITPAHVRGAIVDMKLAPKGSV